MSTPSVLRVPDFVTARSPKGLRDRMLEINARDGYQYDWLKAGISFNPADKLWYAWYNRLMDLNFEIDEVTDGN